MSKYLQSTRYLRFDIVDRVAYISLNRPKKRNALNMALLTELRDALIEADALNRVHAIVLQGEGRDFCAGYDIVGSYADDTAADAGERNYNPADYRAASASLADDCWHLEQMQRVTAVLFQVHKPVIAKLQGNCLGGGIDLALMCDLVLAAADARIGFPATRASGTPPHNLWFYHCGPQWAKRLLFTGDVVSGLDAARIGLVLDAFPAAELDAAVDALARRIALVDHELLAAQKRAVNLGLELAGAGTLQRLTAELDARAHLAQGPAAAQFLEDVARDGVRDALKRRDAPFGDSQVRIRWPQQTPRDE